MAASNDFSEPAATGASADDIKALLDILAQEIGQASSPHAEPLQDGEVGAAAMSEHAGVGQPDIPHELSPGCFPAPPHEYGAAIERIEGAMSTLAERLSVAEPQLHHLPPSVDEADCILPETVRAELRRAIMNAQQEMDDAPPVLHKAPADSKEFASSNPPPLPAARPQSFGESGEELAPPAMPPAKGAAAPASAPLLPAVSAGIELSWLDQRFADVADRVEKSIGAHSPQNALIAMGARFDQLEERFDSALDRITTQGGADPEALKAIERQIGELFTQFNRAARQLGRLDAIESRLTDLRPNLSDEQMERLVSALAPTDDKLSALATAAAERVVTTMRDERQAAGTSPDAAPDPGLGELATLIEAFIGDQRQGDAVTSEALETMQLAMQHLIDRVEAIEAAQTKNHDALMRSATKALSTPPTPQAFTLRSPVPAAASPAKMPDPVAPASLNDDIPINVVLPSRQPDTSPAQRARGEPLLPLATPPVKDPHDRHALIAMARRAAERVSSEAPPPAPVRRTGRRTGLLLAASLVMFLIAGFWMFAGTDLRGIITGFGFGTFRSGDMLPVAGPRADVGVSESGPAGKPRASNVVEGDGTSAMDEATARGKVQMASLSAGVVQDPASTNPATASITDPTGSVGSTKSRPTTVASQSPDQSPAQPPAMPRSVEMPPATIGPLSLRLAASKGDGAAQFEVAARFAEGRGVPQDFAQAATWYQRAATHGFATAQYRLGALYERGLGVKADPARARVWYIRAAEQGNVRAMHNLAVLSAGRPGMSQDYPSAVQWFTEAASRGLSDSQYNLGILYESGLGVPANNIEAYKWYALAARGGDKDAISRRDVVRTKLDRSSIKSADALVIQWRASAIAASANDGRVAGANWTGPTASQR